MAEEKRVVNDKKEDGKQIKTGWGMGGSGALPWVEKYRPRLLVNVVGNGEMVKRLRVIAETGSVPTLLLTGPPGTGKTTCLLAMARELLGDRFKDAVLELNASDARGIDVVREKIRTFARKKISLPEGKQKIVILDEADAMTVPAQEALRRLIDNYSVSTRFCLACNNANKIILPIQSRCAVQRFVPVEEAEMKKRLLEIATAEKIPMENLTKDGMEALVFASGGDMRQAIGILQATHCGLGKITAENVYKIADQPAPETVTAILKSCLAHNLVLAVEQLTDLCQKGYSIIDIVSTLQRVAKDTIEIKTPQTRLYFLKTISVYHNKITDHLPTNTQLTALVAQLSHPS
jgi:replication factor C subunit 2/4